MDCDCEEQGGTVSHEIKEVQALGCGSSVMEQDADREKEEVRVWLLLGNGAADVGLDLSSIISWYFGGFINQM